MRLPLDAPPPPPVFHGLKLPVGPLHAEVLATVDFETFSLAGYVWVPDNPKKPLGHWTGPPGAAQGKKGLPIVGARKYAEHPSAEVVTMTFDLKDGKGEERWTPGMPNPERLFAHVAAGKLIEAHHCSFEKLIWEFVCQRKYGWPAFNPAQWRCSAAKSRAWGLPGALAEVGNALGLQTKKDAEGKRLMKMFSMPRDPTKTDTRWRILPAEAPTEFEGYQSYCDTDVATESEASMRVPDLIPQELDYWLCDQAINYRGIGVDLPAVRDCVAIVNQVLEKYGAEMRELTGGLETSQVQALVVWLSAQGVHTKSLDAEAIEEMLARQDLPPVARRVIEIRALTGSASVKKVFSMLNHATDDGRLCDLFIYHGARTGRDTHADVQPGNLPKAGPSIRWCDDVTCGQPYAHAREDCPWCGASSAFSRELSPVEFERGWCWEAVEAVLQVLRLRSVDALEWFFGDALLCVSGVVRSLLVAAEGKSIICSDYSSIEAVVTATLSGEEWRIKAFENREDIYLHGAAGITGHSYEWYQANGGKKHPDRQKFGKPAELACGFGGWVGALYNFGFEGTEQEAKSVVVPWRAASPMIVEMWGGQFRGMPWAPKSFELYGLEGMAVAAILTPGERFTYREISFECLSDVLYMVLPSGRRISYHAPRLVKGARKQGWAEVYSITYMTWNTNPKAGALGWVRIDTYGPKLFENAVQGVARDIMSHAVVALERAGWPVVLRVHDELAAEIPTPAPGTEWAVTQAFESQMTTLPDWCKGWPIRVGGTFIAKRYKK